MVPRYTPNFVYSPFVNGCIQTVDIVVCNNTFRINCSVYGKDRQSKKCDWPIIALCNFYGWPIIDARGQYSVPHGKCSLAQERNMGLGPDKH